MSGPSAQRARAAAALAFGSIVSVQAGAALATTLFDQVGPRGAVFLRSAFGALALLAIAHRQLPALRGRLSWDIGRFGFALAAMNLCFYAAIDRLPLGVAVTLEFCGPLAIALVGSRRRGDAAWALLAAAGIVLLSGGVGGGVDPLGVALALLAGAFWGLYIVQSARLGVRYPGLGALALAAGLAAVLVAPFGVTQGGADLFVPANLAIGCGVGLLSAAIPYTLELEALRRLPRATFGVLMSLEPAVAAAIGFVALGQDLASVELVAIGCVVVASAGAVRSASTPVPRDG